MIMGMVTAVKIRAFLFLSWKAARFILMKWVH